MSYSLQVAGRSRVVVGRTVEELPRLLPQGRVIVLTDRNVARCRPELFEGCDPICMEPGEEHKTLQTVEEVCRELIRRGADRTTFLLGVGGGIVTDVTGFVASVYMRGVPFGFVSTTLLGCVDASVGGKNGVNLDGYKNMAGVFAQPQFVVCDTSLFATLPLREIRAGLAEAVKAGIIGDEPLFGLIERAGLDGLCADPEAMDKVVVHSVRLKAAVVSRDEREHGERRKLNLGHTFGHAVEKCSREMIHGEAVAVGMAKAAMMDGKTHRVYAMIGDGESQEGQIWEAAQFAGQHKLRNFTGFMDYNNMQIDGLVSDQLDVQPVTTRWESFGFACEVVDGHDVAAIDEAIERSKTAGRPTMIILKTIKGKGAYFAEGKVESHNMPITEDMWKACVEGGDRHVG